SPSPFSFWVDLGVLAASSASSSEDSKATTSCDNSLGAVEVFGDSKLSSLSE
ncbi:unnamed protein product, partial [Allacma fusca]